MMTLQEAAGLAAGDSGLAVASTVRADQTIQASLINAGVLPHPNSGWPVVGFVTYGRIKLTNLRSRPQVALTFRNGWKWATVEGTAELAGPDDTPGWLRDGDQHVRVTIEVPVKLDGKQRDALRDFGAACVEGNHPLLHQQRERFAEFLAHKQAMKK